MKDKTENAEKTFRITSRAWFGSTRVGILLALGDPADQVLAIDRVTFLDLEGGHLSAVWGRDNHFLHSS